MQLIDKKLCTNVVFIASVPISAALSLSKRDNTCAHYSLRLYYNLPIATCVLLLLLQISTQREIPNESLPLLFYSHALHACA
jgi:hypothetical protein